MDDDATIDPSTVSPQDRDLWIRTVIGEANNDPSATGVASVIANRMKNSGQSARDVVLAPNQFEPWSSRSKELLSYSPNSTPYKNAAAIVDGVISGQTPDPTGGATKFYAPVAQAALGRKPPAWDDGTGVQIGAHKFFGGNPQVAQNAPKALSDDDINNLWGGAGATQAAPAQKGATPVTMAPVVAPAKPLADADIDALYAAPAPQPSPAKTIPPDAQHGPNGLMWSKDAQGNPSNGYDPKTGELVVAGKPMGQPSPLVAAMAGFLNGVPIAGPSLVSGVERGAGAFAAARGGEPTAQGVDQANALTAAAQAAYPKTTTAAGILGGVAGVAPAIIAAPELMGAGSGGMLANSVLGLGSGALIGGADSAVRSNAPTWGGVVSNALTGAGIGGAFGAAGPAIGRGLGAGINALSNIASRTTPAARNVSNALAEIGMTPSDAQNALTRMGPSATLADIDPAMTTEAGGLAALGGSPTSILKKAMATRAAGADDAMSQIVDDTLGPKPDAVGILNQIRNREVSNNVDLTTARAALDNSMGPPADPQAVLSKMVADRSAAAQPLYEKALSKPVVWDNRLQQFLDDPIFQPALAKGVKIQRLESLADPNAPPFNPTDYAIKDFDAAGDPIIGTTPNMRTLNVVKKGLDAMVSDAQDPITGRLSEEGRAVDGVRRAFLTKLDQINPDYSAARQAWAGPTQTQEAFNKGLNIFRSQTGSSGLSSTPGALDAWAKNPATSQGELDAAKLGARTAFEQQMSNAGDPAAKATMLAGKQANQQKLISVLGPTEGNNLVKQLTFQYEDPIGTAFSKGMDIFKSGQGVDGIDSTPAALKNWIKTASPAEIEAHQQGARQAIEQALTSARQGDVSAARSLFAKSTANREKLEAIFPNASKMLDGLDAQLQMRATEQRVGQNSATAERQAVQQKYSPASSPAIDTGAAILGESAFGGLGAGAAVGGKIFYNAAKNALTSSALKRLTEGTARGLSATGPEQSAFMQQLARAHATNAATNALSGGSNALVNLLTRGAGPGAFNALSAAPSSQ